MIFQQGFGHEQKYGNRTSKRERGKAGGFGDLVVLHDEYATHLLGVLHQHRAGVSDAVHGIDVEPVEVTQHQVEEFENGRLLVTGLFDDQCDLFGG